MTYTTVTGRRITLLYHSPAEWAHEVGKRLLELGCSPAYVAASLAALRPGGDQ